MDPNLEGKMALFGRLETLQNDVGQDDEVFGTEEDKHRDKCKAFAQLAAKKPGIKSRSTFGGIGQLPIVTHRRTASDSLTVTRSTTRAQAEVILIEDTPQPKKLPPGQPRVSSLLRATSNTEADPIPNSTKRASSQPGRRTSHPQLQRTVRSSPPAGDSPSVTMGKRKRATKLKMAPETHQCFKGLLFFYIPNDDVDPARERRIIRAREYGAEWVRTLDQATHVVVDVKFTYKDIEKVLAGISGPVAMIVVNDGYPLECISYKRLLDPSQKQYQIPGMPKPAEKTTEVAQSQEPEKSLEIKPAKARIRKGLIAPATTPPRNNASSQRSTQVSSGQVISESQLGSQRAVVVVVAKNATRSFDGAEHPRSTDPSDPEIARPPIDDELAQCIDYMKANPDAAADVESEAEDDRPSSLADSAVASSVIQDEPDGEIGSSEEERQVKRRKPSKKKKDSTRGNWQDKFACMKGGIKDTKSDNPNADTIDMLQKLLDEYTLNNDQWRTTSYRRAISALRQEPTRITTSEQAKEIAGIGDSIADKIEEIVNTGRLRKHEEAQKDPSREARQLFLKIYDVGLQRANAFINQGHRTLADLVEKADLTRNQRIGIDHYDDLDTRIPRNEVEALGNCVRRAGREIDPRVEMLIGGSYRRGSDTSGDVDLIITKKGTTMSRDLGPFLDELVDRLTKEGFLTVGLATSRSFNGDKWHGCCVLPQEDFPGDRAGYKPIWRRIDFLLVPETEFGGALIYFTGNDLFNRSLRLLANKKGMSLSHRGLSRDVLRGPNREKLTDGVLVEGRDERKIFDILGVKWRDPHQRWC